MRWTWAAMLGAAVAAPASAQDFDRSVRDVLGGDPAAYRTVIEGFQSALRSGDAAAAAAFVRYPIEVDVDGRKRLVRSEAEFAEAFPAIVTPDITASVAAEPLARMMVNWQGVMLGQGEVWVSGICLDEACATSEVKVVAIQPVGDEAAPMVGAVKSFHDWAVGCDNRLGCTALGLPAEEARGGGYVAVKLAAGAGAEPSVDLVLVDPAAPGATMRVVVTGKDGYGPVDWPAVADGDWLRAAVPAAERGAFVAAMRAGERLDLSSGGGEPVPVSLRGATAALLLIDDRQWRIGTVSALARPGDAPAAGVPAAPDGPVVDALPVAALDPAPPAPAGVTPADDPSCAGVGALAFDLGGGVRLWGACDFSGAYNVRYRFWLDGPGGLAPAEFDAPGQSVDDPALLTGPGLSADGRAIEATDLGRGLGDCGATDRWGWTGTGFALLRRAGLDICAGVAPDDWPVLWRAAGE